MVEKVTMNFDLSKVTAPVCISVVVLKNYGPERSYILVELFKKVSEGVLFSRLLEGFIGGACIEECWGKVYS